MSKVQPQSDVVQIVNIITLHLG